MGSNVFDSFGLGSGNDSDGDMGLLKIGMTEK